MQISYLEITAEVTASAGDLARTHGLRGYEAGHLAAAALVNDEELVLVTDDHELGAVARTIGTSVALTTP